MTVSIAFFNNKGGVGKTSLVYHLAWMLSDLGAKILTVDLDPQANLSAAFLEEDRLEELWTGAGEASTIFRCVQPLLRGTGDISEPRVEVIEDSLRLLPGDLSLSGFEDELASEWSGCLDRKERSFRIISAFWRIVQRALHRFDADLVLMDLGPNLGAINRAALIASDHVVIPVSPDLFSLQGLKNLGPTVRRWREEWLERLARKPEAADLDLPEGGMRPMGYVVLQHAVRLDRPVKAYARWIARIPGVYRSEVLGETETDVTVEEDPNCLALLKHYRSLMPLAQEARKPIFHLKPADGAIGSHLHAAQDAASEFVNLSCKLIDRSQGPVILERDRPVGQTPGAPAESNK